MWAFAPLVALLVDVAKHGGVLSGAGGATANPDQFQYLSWIRELGAHGLIANRFELGPSHAVFVQPMFLLSGLAWRLGLSLQLALLMWEPIAIVVLLAGYFAFVSRSEHGSARFAVVLLALFYLTPLLPALDWTGQLAFGARFRLMLGMEELSPVWQLWGYLPTAVALGLMPLTVLAGERALAADERSRTRYLLLAAVGAALVAWLHPWQGATLVLIWVGLIAWGRGDRAHRVLIVPAIAALAPLAYYEILAHADAAWRIATAQNAEPHFPAWVLLAAIAPLALPALPELLHAPRDLHGRITRLWVAGAVLVYFTQTAFPPHALQGTSLPLAVLASAGWRRALARRGSAGERPPFRRPRWSVAVAAATIAAAVIPGAIWSASWYRSSVDSHLVPYVLTQSERAALQYLEHSQRTGGVLAGRYLGMAVPAYTGRRTFVGHKVWTPQFYRRAAEAGALLAGHMSPRRARDLIRSSGAAYVLADCRQQRDLRALVGDVVTSIHRFGCVTVYETG